MISGMRKFLYGLSKSLQIDLKLRIWKNKEKLANTQNCMGETA